MPSWTVTVLAITCYLAYFAAVSIWMLAAGVQAVLVVLFAATFAGSMLTGLALRALPALQRTGRRR